LPTGDRYDARTATEHQVTASTALPDRQCGDRARSGDG
jgi:hypothetical protein